ncbi:metallophosphoesterase [Vreelandella rituensis]|uniref:Metallophosphoesterase n=2 Tax=Vreelandella rituensis TaxID=2282306 RepID=A0A368U9M0_9GAMM|nr:metallophosphoesterase [Halomonas rituensis]
MLRQIERQYRAPCQGDIPLFVSDPEHTTGTVYVCGDIHGQYDALQAELARVGFDRQRDLLYCTGDLVDRGADSFKCLSLAFEPWSRFILGNHERLAWDALKDGPGPGNAWDHWQANGGSWVYLEGALEVKSILGEALRHLPLAREITIGDRRIGFCHAEPPANWQWVRDNPEAYIDRLTWGRTRHTRGDTTPVEGIDAVVVGHTIVDTPTWYGNVHFLDTGAFTPYGHLTLIPLQEVVDALTKPAGGSA